MQEWESYSILVPNALVIVLAISFERPMAFKEQSQKNGQND